MFQNILVPTDGSRLSAKAVKTAARLAKSVGARITGVYVMEPYQPPVYGGSMMSIPGANAASHRRAVQRVADKALAEVRRAADAYGVPSSSVALVAADPWRAILRAARGKRCDAVVMASHGRSGIAGVILGSETAKVLTHSKVPVLVCR